MSSGLLQAGGKKKPDYGAQIGVPGSVSNWDSSSTLQVELRTRAPSVHQCCTLDQYVFSRSETTRRVAIRALFCDICLCFNCPAEQLRADVEPNLSQPKKKTHQLLISNRSHV